MKWLYFLLTIVILANIPLSNAYSDDKAINDNARNIEKNKRNVNRNKNTLSGQQQKINSLRKNQKSLDGKSKELKEDNEKLENDLIGLKKEQKEQQKDLGIQEKTLLNHAGQLNSIENNSKEIKILKGDIHQAENVSGGIKAYIDRFWVLIAAVLVFFMQAGFKTFEAGMVRKEHDDNVAIKNVLDWLIICLVYYLVGFAVMFGESWHGFIGSNLFLPNIESLNEAKGEEQNLGLEFFLYQLAFAATAATIVSGAMSERTALIPYVVLSVFIGAFIYPLFGHWVWAGTYLPDQSGWLEAIGFRDFAGSTVVHSVGAWVALAGIIAVGARHGRYDVDGNINTKNFQPSSLGYSVLGVFILWFGWWGFNGASGLEYNETIAPIILNTTLAGAAAGMTAFFHALSQSRDKYDVFPKLLGGILGGLVAITACCNIVTAEEAIVIGVIAGLIHNYSYDFLMITLKLDDPVGAIAVHGFCGVWGTLSVALFGELSNEFFMQNTHYLFFNDSFSLFSEDVIRRIEQTIIQLFGIIVAFVFAFSSAYIFFKLIRMIPFIGLRVRVKDEKEGTPLGISF